ncbi:BT_3928 family protein [Marinigracilibium pacificum]|uniref:DoxX family protein n=1 Tax=Marinigracilibium pacificum TaxID=2729599 RepID=A0A848J6T1_9BACT|nr:BT_3928 family protein [Marinigracilibium pacificum]NMM48822.1 DoxX family protein [Marinigracilibium pacificum]
MKTFVNNTFRIFVGGLFIFSGLVKLNDPQGTAIKMTEYFQVFAEDFLGLFQYLVPAALPIAFAIIVFEILVGIALLINYNMNLTTKVLLAMIVFFTFLTFYSAYFNKVTDCGCFGDAIPLTPWESFYKDVVLLVMSLWLFVNRKDFVSTFRSLTANSILFFSAIIFTIVGIYAIKHLPYIDFRPYAIGESIPQNMQPAARPIFEYTFLKDGEEIKSREYIQDEGYKYVSNEVINKDESEPKITDYSVESVDGEDATQETFEGIKLLIIIESLEKTDAEAYKGINSLLSRLKPGIEPMVLTAVGPSEFDKFRHQVQLGVPYYFTDHTVLKAMVRSNPGLILVQDGVVKGKWHHNDTPEPSDIHSLID